MNLSDITVVLAQQRIKLRYHICNEELNFSLLEKIFSTHKNSIFQLSHVRLSESLTSIGIAEFRYKHPNTSFVLRNKRMVLHTNRNILENIILMDLVAVFLLATSSL